jgi:hypothetical protein
METANYIAEAKRYIDNAKEILRDKANKKAGYYTDAKYVKMAGHTAYTGVLVALDGVFGRKSRGRKDIDWYRQQTQQWNKKLLPVLNSAYETLHLFLGYDGAKDARIAQIGIDNAEKIIKAAEA